jgi:DNA repair and recombination protein RAD54B
MIQLIIPMIELCATCQAHRMKNAKMKTNTVLSSLNCTRRVCLTGTPVQNDLKEFFAIADFAASGALGSAALFTKVNSDHCTCHSIFRNTLTLPHFLWPMTQRERCSFCCPTLWAQVYEEPIVRARQPGASAKDTALGEARSLELSSLIQSFFLRRTNEINARYYQNRLLSLSLLSLSRPKNSRMGRCFTDPQQIYWVIAVIDISLPSTST